MKIINTLMIIILASCSLHAMDLESTGSESGTEELYLKTIAACKAGNILKLKKLLSKPDNPLLVERENIAPQIPCYRYDNVTNLEELISCVENNCYDVAFKDALYPCRSLGDSSARSRVLPVLNKALEKVQAEEIPLACRFLTIYGK